MSDLISRQAAIEAINKIFPADPMRDDYTQGITCGAALATEYIKQLPSAQPERAGRCVWCDGIEGRRLRIEFYWIDDDGNTASFSEPHIVATGIAKYCPECGRKLKMEVEHD